MTEDMNIMDHLITMIQSGKVEPDDKLPSENELADQFKVPRISVRKAYERLQELGFVYSRQGKGSFVRDRNLHIPLTLFAGKSFSRKMRELGFNYESVNIFCDLIEPNHKIEEALGVQEGERIFKIGRLRKVDGYPIALHISYVSEAVFPDISRIGRDISSAYEFYESRGYTSFISTETTLRLAYPSKYEREWLGCASLIPLLVLESDCRDRHSGRTLEYTRTLYRGDCFTYRIGD